MLQEPPQSTAHHASGGLATGFSTEALPAPKHLGLKGLGNARHLASSWVHTGTRQIGAGKSNPQPRRQEVVATTAPLSIKHYKTSGPEETSREMLDRGNPKEKENRFLSGSHSGKAGRLAAMKPF